MYLSLCVLGILAVPASAMLQQRDSVFHYARSPFRRSDDCNICYDGDCLPLEQSQCDYYEQVDSLIPKGNEDPEGFRNMQLKYEVDNLIFNIIEKAAIISDIECIPYISRFTDCNKENICLGCKTCSCTSVGKWNCSTTTHCRIQTPAIDINHKVLILALENLLSETKNTRRKRSASKTLQDAVLGTATLEELSEWLYGAKPSQNSHPTNTNRHKNRHGASLTTHGLQELIQHEGHTPVEIVTKSTSSTDTDYLAFDEVLKNIAIDTKNYSRRKPPPEIESDKPVGLDYLLLDEDGKPTTGNTSSLENVTEISYIVNFVRRDNDASVAPAEETTKIVIDLLEAANPNYSIFNDTDFNPNKEILARSGFNNNNDMLDFNTISIMKRDLNAVSGKDAAINVTENINQRKINILNFTTVENETEPSLPPPLPIEKKTNLKEDVLLPIVKVMNNKVDELQNLKKIKENLINFMNSHNQSPIVEIIDYPNISASSSLHDIEMFPDIGYDLRRNNQDFKQKFLYKFKSDVYEVIKDILGLQRYRQGDLPEDLNYLIHSLKRYVANSKPYRKRTISKPIRSYRRHYDPNVNKCLTSTFKQCIIELLQTIDKETPKMNALGPLSPASRRIMRHVLRTLYSDDFNSLGFQVNDPNYNISQDLSNIGSKWQDMSNIIGNSPFVALYRMKLLHYFLEMDIHKLTEVLTLVSFAHSRRTAPYFNNVENKVMDQINSGLDSIHNKVEVIVNYYSKKNKADDIIQRSNDETTETVIIEQINHASHEQHQQKKRSFIKYIRNLLKSSKKDIHELLHRQVPKSEIVKQLARKKLDELAQKRYNEYEEAMRKWQKNLGVMSRYKRNADEVLSRIKNIIPNYLRHKVKPKLHEKKKNVTHKSDKKDKKKKRQGRQNKHKKTSLTTATTPKIRATTLSKTKKTTKRSRKSSKKFKNVTNKHQ